MSATDRIFPISDLLVGIRQQENLTFEEAMEDVYEGLRCNTIGQEAVPPGTATLLTLSKESLDANTDIAMHHARSLVQNSGALPLTGCDIAAIAMYTVESPFYRVMNKILRQNMDRKSIIPFLKFIWLYLQALSRCPMYKGRMVYRAFKDDVSAEYVKDSYVDWYAFSSATANIAVELKFLTNDSTGCLQGTLFHIELTTSRGRLISPYSMLPNEDEVVLPLCCKFRVVDCLNTGNGLIIIQLEEVEPDEPVIDFSNDDIERHSNISNTIEATRNTMHNTLNAVRDFAKITTSVVADVVDGLDKLVSEYASSSSSSNRKLSYCEADTYEQHKPLPLVAHPEQHLIDRMVSLGFERSLVMEAIEHGCLSDLQIVHFISPPPQSERPRSGSTTGQHDPQSELEKLKKISILTNERVMNMDIAAVKRCLRLIHAPYNDTMDDTTLRNILLSRIPDIRSEVARSEGVLERKETEKLMSDFGTSLSQFFTPAAAVVSTTASTVGQWLFKPEETKPPVALSKKPSAAAKHAAAKLRTGFTPEEAAKLKQILALRKDEVDHLPIPELRGHLVFLKVVHTFDMPVETLRDMLWRNILISKS